MHALKPNTDLVGYTHLRNQCAKALPPSRSIAVREKWRGQGRSSVPMGVTVVVPFESIDPDSKLIDHVLVALRYEGVDLSILGESLKMIPAQDVLARFDETPNGEYIRRAAYLWEHFNQQPLEGLVIPRRRTIKLFNPDNYYTRHKGKVDSKWAVEFNGLGSLTYCPTVRRDKRLDDADAALWRNYEAFIRSWGGAKEPSKNPSRLFNPKTENSILARTMRHAFLDETESSFRIESEEPSGNKMEQFVQLLKNAHGKQVINEEFLTALQRFCVDGRWHEFQYRDKQNWLGNGSRNIRSRVTYVPPPSEILPEIMETLCDLINSPQENDLPAIAQAGVVSFGFVFAHPFLDGNGRISRYLAHQSLCNSDKLPHGMVIPLSAAILGEQESYLAALTDFSAPMRALWDVDPSGDPDVPTLTFNGSDLAYRYWDGGACSAFMTDMGRIALDEKLINEAIFLRSHDQCLSRIQEVSSGLPDKDISKLIRMAVSNTANPGTLSTNKKKQFSWVGEDAMSDIETIIKESFTEYFEAIEPEMAAVQPEHPRNR